MSWMRVDQLHTCSKGQQRLAGGQEEDRQGGEARGGELAVQRGRHGGSRARRRVMVLRMRRGVREAIKEKDWRLGRSRSRMAGMRVQRQSWYVWRKRGRKGGKEQAQSQGPGGEEGGRGDVLFGWQAM